MSPLKYIRAFYQTTSVQQEDVITLTTAEELDGDNISTTNSVSNVTKITNVKSQSNKSFLSYYLIIKKVFIIIAVVSVFTFITVTGLNLCKIKMEYSQQLKQRRVFIRSMARSAWTAYKQYAWNHGALKPTAKRPMPEVDHDQKPGYTILAAMTTLKVMGLEKEFNEGRNWILNNPFEDRLAATKQYLIVDWPINAYIGSLMSLYALTGETVYREKAVAIEKVLEPAFDNQTGLLHLELHPANKIAKTKIYSDEENENREGSASNNFLFFIGHQSPAFLYLADATNNSKLKVKLQKIFETIRTVDKPSGLYFEAINVKTGKWSKTEIVDAEHGVFFFNDLIQSYLMQSENNNSNNKETLKIYCDAIQAMVDVGMFQEISLNKKEHSVTDSTKGILNVTFFSRYYHKERRVETASMTSPACIFGAVLAMGSKELEKIYGVTTQSSLFWSLAIKLTTTCRLAAESTETGLLPQSFMLTSDGEIVAGKDPFQSRYFLDSNYVQSLFVLWRLTKKEQYREYAWEFANAIQKHCHVGNSKNNNDSNGYTDVEDVNVVPTHYLIDYQPPQFLSATLKYLYLIFEEDDVLPLDQWVFTDAGQPLPICGRHERYPKTDCS